MQPLRGYAGSIRVRRAAFECQANFGRHVPLRALPKADIDPMVGDEFGDRGSSERLHMHENVGLALAFADKTKAAGAIEPFDLRPYPTARG